jgi:hypothetical protein
MPPATALRALTLDAALAVRGVERRLQDAGVTRLHTMTYSPFGPCVPEIARSLDATPS